jgi:hypothetical protein
MEAPPELADHLIRRVRAASCTRIAPDAHADGQAGRPFLTDELDYSPAFEIPAAEDMYIIAFRNDSAARQVEVSGRSLGSRFHCEIRRLLDGEPGSYETDSISHAELERVREPATPREVYRSFEEDVAHTIALLRRHGDLLRGESWIESDTLSPHELALRYKLIYRRGDTIVEVVLDDFRLDEWFVKLDGKTIHYFRPWSDSELMSALSVIESAL